MEGCGGEHGENMKKFLKTKKKKKVPMRVKADGVT